MCAAARPENAERALAGRCRLPAGQPTAHDTVQPAARQTAGFRLSLLHGARGCPFAASALVGAFCGSSCNFLSRRLRHTQHEMHVLAQLFAFK